MEYVLADAALFAPLPLNRDAHRRVEGATAVGRSRPHLLAPSQASLLGAQVFKAISKEDFEDVVKLLPENTPQLPSYNMTYLIARLELHPAASIQERLTLVNEQDVPMADTVGPAVGCLMATFGTNMISSRIFDVVDPQDLKEFAVEERMELWGLRVQV